MEIGDWAISNLQSPVSTTPHPTPHPVPIIGVPGYPVSAALTGEIFVEPLLARWQGRLPYEPPTIQAKLTRKINSHTGDDDFVRVAVGKVGDNIMTTPISRGAGVITSLVRADGIVRIPRFSEGEEAGATVTVWVKAGTDTGSELFSGRGSAVWNNDGDTAVVKDNGGSVVDNCSYTGGGVEAACE